MTWCSLRSLASGCRNETCGVLSLILATFTKSEQGVEIAQGFGHWAEAASVTAHPPQCLLQKPDSSGGHWKSQGFTGRLGLGEDRTRTGNLWGTLSRSC